MTDPDSDYIRTPIPAIDLLRADGTLVGLRDLVAKRAVLLVFVPRDPVAEMTTLTLLPRWQAQLPRLRVVAVRRSPAQSTPSPDAPLDCLFDPDWRATGLFGDVTVPTAVLLGADGLLAGGPVGGTDAVARFVADIASQLESDAHAGADEHLAISCKCITYGRGDVLEEALASFLLQESPGPRELVIVNDYPLQHLRFDHPDVRVYNVDAQFPTIGEKVNYAVDRCQYDTIAVWDDDDIALPNHLANINRYMPGHDLLFWERGAAMLDNRVQAINPMGYAGRVYSRRKWEEIGRHAHEDAGFDATFVSRMGAARARTIQADPPHREVSFCYRWGGGVYHVSGLGTDDGTRPSATVRHAEHIEALRRQGEIPTGDIQLRPRWRHDYPALVAQFCDEMGY